MASFSDLKCKQANNKIPDTHDIKLLETCIDPLATTSLAPSSFFGKQKIMLAEDCQGVDHNYRRRLERHSLLETDLQSSPVSQCTWVELRPFSHQVGGHNCVFEVNPYLICKPYTEREAAFYETHPDELTRFIPSFQGMIQVKCKKHRGELSFSGHVPNTLNTTSELTKMDNWFRNTRKTSKPVIGLDSWSLSCIDRQINKYGFWTERTSETFIMLDNLVANYKYPCILDIKLGTRQYDDDSSLEKRKLLQDRCKNSTSSSLGLRICGMQVYMLDEQIFVKYDKYHGRSLDEQGVRRTLRQFFHNGRRYRSDMRLEILEKLKDLINVLENEKSFVFLTCSLLMIYDGKDTELTLTEQEILPTKIITDMVSNPVSPSSNADCMSCRYLVDVRIIDFAHTIKRDQALQMETNGEEGILFGLKTLVNLLEKIS